MSAQPVPETVTREAARWFARSRSGAMSARELRELEVWLAEDAARRAAYEHLARLWDGAESVRNDPEVMEMREAAARAQVARRWRTAVAIAASLLVVAFAGAGVANWMTAGRNASPELVAGEGQQEFRTSVGQTATVTLADGSAVTLDSDSVLRTRATWNRRYAELAKGRAFFRVAHEPTRPFVVLANGRTVTALGTSFEVSVERGKFEVTLVSGKVRVEQPPDPRSDRPVAVPPPVVMRPGATPRPNWWPAKA
ncbi:MAG TPA: FecR domain-containing protein, partial [Caulobacteraceae bacterium]